MGDDADRALVGGLVVALADQVTARELALRLPFVIAVVGNLLLFVRQPPPHDRRIEAAARLEGPSPAAV